MNPARSPLKAVIIGAGGHARVIAALLRERGTHEVAGVLDRECGSAGENILGIQIIGTWSELHRLRARGIHAAFLALGNSAERKEMFAMCEAAGLDLPPLVHPRAYVDPSATLGSATVVCAMAHVGAEASVGRGAIVNTGASIDHESTVGDFATISPAVTVAGRSKIGAGAFLGLGCGVSDGIVVGEGARVGAGAIVLADVRPGDFVVGIPAAPKVNGSVD